MIDPNISSEQQAEVSMTADTETDEVAEDKQEEQLPEQYMIEMRGETPFFIETYPRITIISSKTQIAVARLVFREIENHTEVFTRICSLPVLTTLADSALNCCTLLLESIDQQKSELLSLPMEKSDVIQQLLDILENAEKCIPLIKRLQKES